MNCVQILFKKMESAYQFQLQSVVTDAVLNKLKELLKYNKLDYQPVLEDSLSATDDEDFGNNPMKQLEAIIKKEPKDSDIFDDTEECYYVLVVYGKEKSDSPEFDKIQIEERTVNSTTHDFKHSIDLFHSEHAKILENKETQNSGVISVINKHDPQNSNSQEGSSTEHELEELQNTHVDGPIIEINLENNAMIKNNSLKILSSNHKPMLGKSDDGNEYVSNEYRKAGEEFIFCDCVEDSSHLSVFGSKQVIEYSDSGHIPTVIQQEDGSFLCDCGEVCDDLSEYEKHQSKHESITTDHLCNTCGKSYESQEILTGHKLLHTATELRLPCPFCNQVIKRNILTQHIRISHNNIKPCCSVCGKKFANGSNLKRHMMIHCGIRDFECKICKNKTFTNVSNLKRHMMIHRGVRDFECDICKKRFDQRSTMQAHKYTHINASSIFCTQCDQLFQSKDELTNHTESGECSKSKVIKVKENVMKAVKQLVTTKYDKVLGYACSLCKKMFLAESLLEQHIENSHMLDPNELICSDCGEVLPSKRKIQSHMIAHKTAKMKNANRFSCKCCGKKYNSQAMLLMHEKVHTNERPFPCQLCSLSFKTKVNLRTHQLTHTREKNFGCPVCKKFFALKGNLIVHLRLHTGERPYLCMVCNEAFIDSKNLKKHKLKKHGIASVSFSHDKLRVSGAVAK